MKTSPGFRDFERNHPKLAQALVDFGVVDPSVFYAAKTLNSIAEVLDALGSALVDPEKTEAVGKLAKEVAYKADLDLMGIGHDIDRLQGVVSRYDDAVRLVSGLERRIADVRSEAGELAKLNPEVSRRCAEASWLFSNMIENAASHGADATEAVKSAGYAVYALLDGNRSFHHEEIAGEGSAE